MSIPVLPAQHARPSSALRGLRSLQVPSIPPLPISRPPAADQLLAILRIVGAPPQPPHDNRTNLFQFRYVLDHGALGSEQQGNAEALLRSVADMEKECESRAHEAREKVDARPVDVLKMERTVADRFAQLREEAEKEASAKYIHLMVRPRNLKT